MEHLNIMLLGKTGNGKSATGNTILGRKVFMTLASTSTVTSEIQFNYSQQNGKVIKVVDTPGLCPRDLHEQSENLCLAVETTINQAVAVCPTGYHAIVLVVKFNGHFTKEDVSIVEKLNSIFGEKFVKQMCILVMTHGDNFDNEDLGSFKYWCSIQENDAFNILRRYCNEEIILFNNKTKDINKLESQLKQLLKCVTSDNKNQFLTKQKELAEKVGSPARQSKSDSKGPFLPEKLLQESSLIVQQLTMIDLSNPAIQRTRLAELKDKAKNLLKGIRDQDRTTVALGYFFGNAINISNSVEDQRLTSLDAEEIYAEQGGRERSDRSGKAMKENGEVKLMELRLKEDARKVEEENINLINDWTEYRIQNGYI